MQKRLEAHLWVVHLDVVSLRICWTPLGTSFDTPNGFDFPFDFSFKQPQKGYQLTHSHPFSVLVNHLLEVIGKAWNLGEHPRARCPLSPNTGCGCGAYPLARRSGEVCLKQTQ